MAGDDDAFNPWGDDEDEDDDRGAPANGVFFDVVLPSGARFQALTQEEADHLNAQAGMYREQFMFENVSDQAALDQLVMLEQQLFRTSLFLGRNLDYNGRKIDAKALRTAQKELSAESRQVRKNLGIDKVARDRTRGEGSLHQFIQNLLEWAHRFVIVRNESAVRANTLAMQMISLVDLHKNCVDEAEQRHLAATPKDIIDWIDKVFRPEFLEIDEAFRNGDQQYWIRST